MSRTNVDLNGFTAYMMENEKSENTVEKYSCAVEEMGKWIMRNEIDEPFGTEENAKLTALGFKNYLKASTLRPSSVNVKLAAVNLYLKYLGYDENVRYIRLQKRIFTEESREMTVSEYRRLVKAAMERGNERLALIMETMASTGMRVSELKYVTVESLRKRKLEIDMKNKVRIIFLPQKLCIKLYIYAGRRDIKSGQVFLTGSGHMITRKQVWSEMKNLCQYAGIESTKVFPHNMRHVFAKTYYKQCKDIARLADILGHSSLETTRIYLMESGLQCEKQINSLDLVS